MKTWEKPVLVILSRTRNEVVLSVCKGQDPAGVEAAAPNGTPATYYGACMYQLAANSTIPCASCQATDAS
jgi:hypothetical protein